ncbi:MAG TPA: pentapeptide repeat-containing protein [Dermatophilaceae bacterium]
MWPADKPKPTASSLNWLAGQPPTPNQVSTALSAADGEIDLYNLAGNVDVIVDITGYLTPADLSDYYTKAQVDAANATQDSIVAALQSTVSSLEANTYTKAQVDTGLAAAAACKEYPHVIVDWHGCNLYGAFLSSANLTMANLSGANLTMANLSGANLYGIFAHDVTLAQANLTNADLTHANLSGANLTGATGMGTATLTAVTWLNTTCPDGTNSDSHGNTCVGHL